MSWLAVITARHFPYVIRKLETTTILNNTGLSQCSLSRGSAIAKIVGANATKFAEFDDRVNMFVYEEMIDGKKLTEIINTTHENIKYLPGHQLPPNVVSTIFLMCPSSCYVNFQVLFLCALVIHLEKSVL